MSRQPEAAAGQNAADEAIDWLSYESSCAASTREQGCLTAETFIYFFLYKNLFEAICSRFLSLFVFFFKGEFHIKPGVSAFTSVLRYPRLTLPSSEVE